mmetsp:Transcript_3047/g.6759  ORF Transcript_3047/g.6759 Transcript_3047/m.6759 type:complete len:236 (+) Transcript_3047:1089-1796(+)
MLLALAIVFAETKQSVKTCRDIVIKIADTTEQQFVTKTDIRKQLTDYVAIPILGTSLKALKTKKIENVIKNHNFVHTAIAYKNWTGDLKVKILPRRPVARIIYPYQQDQYVDADGTLLPISDKYTARVLLIELSQYGVEKSLAAYAYGTALLTLLTYIDSDPFWRAQITYIRMNEKGRVVMHTQVSKQRIEFGLPEAIEEKLVKLKLFYKQIIPYKGWNTYKRVNVEFDNQIVCE